MTRKRSRRRSADTSDLAWWVRSRLNLAGERVGPGAGLARFAKLWCDSGFKRTFIEHCRNHYIGVEVVKYIYLGFKALLKRWIVERIWVGLCTVGV